MIFPRPPWDLLKRAALWLFAGLTMLSGYGLTKLEPFGPARELPLTALDHLVPFLPWTIWVYGTASTAALFAFLQAPDRLACRRLYFSVALAACCCWWFFLLFPTTYPRGLYPLPTNLDAWTLSEFAGLRGRDTPSNCFPSQHVALAWSLGLTWAGFQKRRWAKGLPVLWATLVTLGTLTTKQHFVWDVPPGFLIGAGSAALMAWAIVPERPRAEPILGLTRPADRRVLAGLRERARTWSLDELPWPARPLPPLDPVLVRLVGHVVWIEEIAGLNFRLLARATADADLAALYERFAEDERRHADGLRRILACHGAEVERPGLGNSLVLDQFDTLGPVDAVLIAVSNPVFETFLDAGTIPFLQTHEALRGPLFDAFVERVNGDEAAHLATNWLVTREMARRYSGVSGLFLLVNPSVVRGALGIPWMALDVYTLAWRLGLKFETLLPTFGRLWTLHQRHPELRAFPLWWSFRLFVACGATATWACASLDRAGLLFGGLWVQVTRVTDRFAWAVFGPALLARRGLTLEPAGQCSTSR